MKILVVDDCLIALKFIKLYIELAGFQGDIVLKLCVTSNEAIEAIKSESPDVLFTDYQFGCGTGRDVALWIDHGWEKPLLVTTHSNRSAADAKRLFKGVKCVQYFTSWGEKEKLIAFVKQCCCIT